MDYSGLPVLNGQLAATEAATSGNVIATAKRYGIQAQQIYRRRDRLLGRHVPPEFAAVSIVPDPLAALPAPVRISIVRMAVQMDVSKNLTAMG